ncbi:MAG: hypothetical protein M3041_14815 [Acidobacteriota bacterium]|nr:hypothetical protein [Acidobacteriota bacterium]
MSGRRLIIGAIVMGVILPLALFLLLGLQTPSQLFTIAASTFLAWGVADLLASILEKPRLKNRTPGGAIREDWERRAE